MSLLRWNKALDGVLDERAMRHKLESLGYIVTRYVYPPGTLFDTHTHDVDKIDAVVAGRFRITLPTTAVILEPGDAIEVPRGLPHSAEVVGTRRVVSLDAVRV